MPPAPPNAGWAQPPAGPPPIPPPNPGLPGQPPVALAGPWNQPALPIPVATPVPVATLAEPLPEELDVRRARILMRKSREQTSLLVIALLFGGVIFFGFVIFLLILSLGQRG